MEFGFYRRAADALPLTGTLAFKNLLNSPVVGSLPISEFHENRPDHNFLSCPAKNRQTYKQTNGGPVHASAKSGRLAAVTYVSEWSSSSFCQPLLNTRKAVA